MAQVNRKILHPSIRLFYLTIEVALEFPSMQGDQ
jgi:hypothetical protein